MKQLIPILFLFFLSGSITAQRSDTTDYSKDLIQFSGVIVNGSDLTPIPFVSIMISHSLRGTIADNNGYFSLVAAKGDTIHFTSIGFQSSDFVIPDTLATKRYSLIQVLESDTVLLSEHQVYPWPSKEQFKEAFLSLNEQHNEFERVKHNIDMASQAEENVDVVKPGYASMAYKYQMQQYQSKLYYAGQYPTNNLLNPIAWAQFIKSWKNNFEE
ncbi:MAG: hypothetical protein CL843_12440 [Crocinitomicaceae bacterium]|nr:hypothetical protein [Crocinitomicaceae bacterium]|tara:strand:+ start:135 stop:776 length:642 start_codon:yes stop_codon:yes gene_type:complete